MKRSKGLGTRSKGLGTVIGTVIFLLIALAVLGTLMLISYREQLFSVQLSQAQTLMSEKNAESLNVKVVNLGKGQTQGIICIQNQGTVSSYVEYIVIVPVNNQGQINGPPIQIIGSNAVTPNPIPPGGTALVSLNPNLPLKNTGVIVVTAYGNAFQGGQLGGGG